MEFPLAYIAHVTLHLDFVRVLDQMVLHVRFLPESSTAELTAEGFNPEMGAFMDFEIAIGDVPSMADLTLEGFLNQMGSLMTLHVREFHKSMMAYVTGKRFVGRMLGLYVVLQP